MLETGPSLLCYATLVHPIFLTWIIKQLLLGSLTYSASSSPCPFCIHARSDRCNLSSDPVLPLFKSPGPPLTEKTPKPPLALRCPTQPICPQSFLTLSPQLFLHPRDFLALLLSCMPGTPTPRCPHNSLSLCSALCPRAHPFSLQRLPWTPYLEGLHSHPFHFP